MNKHYSPQLGRDLVRILYYEARARGIPMTVLANELIRKGMILERVLECICQYQKDALGSPSFAGSETLLRPRD